MAGIKQAKPVCILLGVGHCRPREIPYHHYSLLQRGNGVLTGV